MRVTRELEQLAPPVRGAVVSIGVFDGVHVGHRAILEANVAAGRARGLEPTVVTFRQHPKQVLLGRAPRTLTSLEHRLELFQRAGIEHTVALAFDEELRSRPAEDFIRGVLIEAVSARHFVLGFDSKFGKDRRGGPELLRELGHGVEVVDRVLVRKWAVSSTAIREAVELGDLEAAAAMLGRPVSVLGRVVEGRQLGRTIGFPTANLDLDHELHPPVGVYAGRARRTASHGEATQASWPAVINIGYRPTVEEAAPSPLLEVHLIDQEEDLYGAALEVEFVARIRGEQRFDGLEALQAQIGRDVEAARELLLPPR